VNPGDRKLLALKVGGATCFLALVPPHAIEHFQERDEASIDLGCALGGGDQQCGHAIAAGFIVVQGKDGRRVENVAW